MSRVKLRRLAFAATLIPAAGAPQDSDATRHVGASSLNLRAAPAGDAVLLQRLRLNQPLRLLNDAGRWCEVQSPDGVLRGFVDCAFLVRTPVTLTQIETELAETALALLRLGEPAAGLGSGWAEGLRRQPGEGRRLLEALFQQVDRHFAYSPSLHTYADAGALLRQLRQQLPAPSEQPELDAVRRFIDARIALLPAMRAALTADFANPPQEVLHRPMLGELVATLDRRQARAWARLGGRSAPAAVASSFFAQGRWAIGWAGGPLAQRIAGPGSSGATYALRFDGVSVRVLADVIEMAKQHRAVVRTRFGRLDPQGAELAQARTAPDGTLESAVVETRLPAWGVTDRGLVAGTLRRVAYFGDACAGEQAEATRAEVVFAQPVQGPLHAVFVASAPPDPARATVQVQRRRFLAPLFDLFENTLTDRVQIGVDLDGDAVPDLRVVVSSDTAVGGRPPLQRVAMQPVGGWYAHDVYSLEANVDGAWRMLSLYNVVTCT